MSSGFWDKEDAGKTNPNTNGPTNYLKKDGQYLARIDLCKTGKNRQKIGFACCQFTVLADLTSDDSSHHKVGEQVTVLVRQDNDYFMRDWITFIQNIVGEDMTNATADEKVEALELVFGSENPLGGTLIEVHGRHVLRKDGDPDDPKQYYTICDWVREIRAYEAIGMLDEKTKHRYFEDGQLEALAAAHQKEDEPAEG